MREAAAQGQKSLCSPWHCGWGWAELARAGKLAWKELWLRKFAYSLFFHYHLNSRGVSFVHWSLLVTTNRLWWSVFREAQVSPWCSPLLCQHIWKIWIRMRWYPPGNADLHYGERKQHHRVCSLHPSHGTSPAPPPLHFPLPLRTMIYQSQAEMSALGNKQS